jgi:AcrR family transcriptional regulator
MPYDASATRARIFEAAAEEFAAEGIAGARVDRIAERAHANKASIYSYFGSKDELFEAVLRDRVGVLGGLEIDPAGIPEYVGRLFDLHFDHPDLVRLLQYEALAFGAEGVPWQDDAPRSAHYRANVASIREAQARGLVNRAVPAESLLLALNSLVGWFAAVPQITRILLDDAADPGAFARHRATLVTLARSMILPLAESSN